MPVKREIAQSRRIEKTKSIVSFILDHPELTLTEAAEKLGMSRQLMSHYTHSPEMLRMLRDSSHKKVLSMMPLAVKGFEDSLKSSNAKIKYLSSTDLLKSEKILGPERMDITIQDNSSKTVEELQETINRAKIVPPTTIDAELID